MSYRDWHVGMKVVCVDDEWRDLNGALVSERTDPKLREVYTISRIEAACDTPYVRLQGFSYWYEAAAFRPVQPRKTDIAVFTAMLTGDRQQVDA